MSEFEANATSWGDGPRAAMEASFDTPGRVSLRVTNASGEVAIETHDVPTAEVQIVALHPDAEELAGRARVSARETSDGHEVSVEIPHARPRAKFWAGDSAAVGVRVRVPCDTELEVLTASACVAAHGRYRTARVRSASGGISLDEITGSASVRTANGDVEVGIVGDLADIETASGDVRVGVTSAGGKIATASGQVDLGRAERPTRVHTASGDVRLKDALQGATIKTASGDQRIDRAAAGDYVLQAVSGDIAVAVVPGSLVRFDAGSVSGRVASDIEVQSDRPVGGASVDVVELSIQAKTVSGDISVMRAVS